MKWFLLLISIIFILKVIIIYLQSTPEQRNFHVYMDPPLYLHNYVTGTVPYRTAQDWAQYRLSP